MRPVPKWQRERGDRLHRKFLSVEARQAQGVSFKKATRWFVWYWRDRFYQSDRNKQARFALVTLRRLYLQWRKGGRTPAALRLNYRALAPSVPAPVLCRFVDFSATLQFPHMKIAWQEFARRKGAFGRGRRGSNPVAVTYGQLQYFFNGKKFAALQSAQRAVERAENHLAELRWQYTAEIRQRLPDRPRRIRRDRMELSQGSAAR